MITLLSPAKRLDEAPNDAELALTIPGFLSDTALLLDVMKGYGAEELGDLMHLSEKLSLLNYERFQTMRIPLDPGATKAAALLFDGEAYRGLAAPTFSAEDFAFAQTSLRLLSGFYGLLRPLDAIAPYRLEMGTKLKTERGADLYAFWGARLAHALDAELASHEEATIVNVASKEYFKAVDRKALKARVISCHFKEWRDGKAKIITVYAKQARGKMARFLIKNRVTTSELIRHFDFDGYSFDEGLSSENDWVFTRFPV